MPTTQLNTRIDANLKERGDRVLARRGFTPSTAIRALWSYADTHGDVPPFLLEEQAKRENDECAARIQKAKDGYGMAIRMAQELASDPSTFEDVLSSTTWEDLREEMYEERLDDLLERTAASPC